MRRRSFRAVAVWSLFALILSACGVAVASYIAYGGWGVYFNALVGLLLGLSFGTAGLVLLLRRAGGGIGWAFLVVAASQSISAASFYGDAVFYGGHRATRLAEIAAWVGLWAWTAGFATLFSYALLLFPDGRLLSQRWRWVGRTAIAGALLAAIPVAVVAWSDLEPFIREEGGSGAVGTAVMLQNVGLLLMAIAGAASIGSLFVRYRRANADQRSQLRWFLFAALVELWGILALSLLHASSIVGLVGAVVLAPLLPAALAVAVLRYRLYELDRIVSRTLSYAVLTAVLVGLYMVVAVLIPAAVTRESDTPDVLVAIGTLAAAAAFAPLRRRIQARVDRRFNRARYDAERTLERFALRLREQVDVDVLDIELRRLVGATMQPTHASLWMPRRGTR